MRLIGIICVSALLVALAIPAYAETQSVKISGDITVYGVYRDQYDLNKDIGPDSDNFAMSIVEVQVDADLTDNVATVIRLVNQRNWGDSDYPSQRFGPAFAHPVFRQDLIFWKSRLVEVGVDLAYVTLKEMIFEPLTLTIGRQDLWFGRGFIIGRNQRDPGFIGTAVINNNALQPFGTDQHAIGMPEATAYESFDAVRANIDFEKYAPLVVDIVYAKIDEGMIGTEEDVDLYGVNVGYTFDVYNAEAEAYYWLKHDDSISNSFIGDASNTNTIGIRGSFNPAAEWVFGGEIAHQFGTYISPRQTDFANENWQTTERDRSAWAADIFAEYLGWQSYAWSPKVGIEYIFWSGDKNVNQNGGTFSGWDRMFVGYFPTYIRPFQGLYYMTDRHPGGTDEGLTNQHQVLLTGSIQPLDDVSFEARAAHFWFDENPDGRFYGRDGDIGNELDLITTYDYTEDVTFSLLTAWFFPGEHYENPARLSGSNESGPDLNPQVATEIVGAMKVSF